MIRRLESVIKIPFRHVVVELYTFSTAEHGDNLHDLFLLLWREQILAVMIAVVRTIATTEVTPDTQSGLGSLPSGNVIIEFREALCLLHQLLLSETLARSIRPSRWIDGWSIRTMTLWQQQPGLIVHATIFICTFTVKTQRISLRNIFR